MTEADSFLRESECDKILWRNTAEYRGGVCRTLAATDGSAKRSCTREVNVAVAIPVPFDYGDLNLMSLFKRPMATSWRWLLGFVSLACGMCYIGFSLFPSSVASLVYATVVAISVPVLMMSLFVDWDLTRNYRWTDAIYIAALSGFVSTTIARIVNGWLLTNLNYAFLAAFTEEPIKLAFMLLVFGVGREYRRILPGLGIGCSVGAGFAVVETIEYGFNYGSMGLPSTNILVVRTLLSPMMHAAWGTLLGGVIAMQWKDMDVYRVVLSPSVLLAFIGMVAYHAVWNILGVNVVLVVVLWILIFFLVRKGILQTREVNQMTGERDK